jgi:hypothetical protein
MTLYLPTILQGWQKHQVQSEYRITWRVAEDNSLRLPYLQENVSASKFCHL